MKILMVTPYPPHRDGLAAYALQSVRRLRAEGHDVQVLSPGPSAAHQHLDLVGPRGAAALARRVRAYDKVIIQFHPDVFYPLPPSQSAWAVESLALMAAVRAARQVEVVVHEIDYAAGRRPGPYALAARALWAAVDSIVVHTDQERQDFMSAFKVKARHVQVEAHGRDFVRHTTADRAAARRSLGIDAADTVALAIGFVQRHKGFDRAVRAFRGLGGDGRRLDVVGSLRVEDAENTSYVEELRALVAATPDAHLHLGYVSDELFDRWLVAADVVLLPYRHIWSSGVLERASLYDRPVIATSVGALSQQAADRPGVTLVADDAHLARALRSALGGARPMTAPAGAWPTPEGAPEGLRSAVQQEVVLRAAVRRGSHVLPAVSDGPDGAWSPLSAEPAGSARSASAAGVDASVPLRRLNPLSLPAARGGRLGAGFVKRLVRRATAWQLDPLVHQVNALQAATMDALERRPDGAEAGRDR
jgi:glycosyltransferase involved in cell wall biosynthesis